MWKGLTIHCEFIIMVRLTGCGEVWYRAWFGSKRPRVRIPTLRPEIWNPHLRVPDFLLMSGFEGPHQSADWRKQVSGKHLLSEKVSAAWLLPSSAHFSSAVPKCQFYSLYCNTRNSLLRLTEFLVLILILSKLTGCLFCRGKKRDQICYKHPPGNIVVSNHLEIAAESFDT